MDALYNSAELKTCSCHARSDIYKRVNILSSTVRVWNADARVCCVRVVEPAPHRQFWGSDMARVRREACCQPYESSSTFLGPRGTGASPRCCSADTGFHDNPRPCTTSNGLITLQDENVKNKCAWFKWGDVTKPWWPVPQETREMLTNPYYTNLRWRQNLPD